MVAAIRLRLRSELRASWRSWLALALFAGVLGGVALTAAAGARRADTAYPRLLRWAHASNATVIPHGSGLDGYYDDLARQPSVESLAVTVLYNMALPTDSATPDTNVSVSASPDGRYGIDVDRVKIVEGRSLDAADPNAALVDRGLAAREHLRAGRVGRPRRADGSHEARPRARRRRASRVRRDGGPRRHRGDRSADQPSAVDRRGGSRHDASARHERPSAAGVGHGEGGSDH